MTIEENTNFKHVCIYKMKPREIQRAKKSGITSHALYKRKNRLSKVLELDKEPKIDKVFLVDRGHKEGQELHCVSQEGIIYIYNFIKLYMETEDCFVTALIARPNQVKRLYEECKLNVNQQIIDRCYEHQKLKFNCL